MTAKVEIFSPDSLGEPLGLYSHIGKTDGFAFVAGQVGMDASGDVVGDDIESQLRQTLVNLRDALTAAGTDLDRVVKFTTYLISADDIERFMEARRKLFPTFFSRSSYPPNTLLVVQRLVRPELKIEVEAIAAI